jgi:Uma2 family endonuclease
MSAVIETVPQTQNLIGNFNGQSVKLHRITVEEYDAMIENGVFDENDQVELLNGAIVEKMPKGNKHSAATDRIAKFFDRNFNEILFVRNQNPIWLDEFSEPEPDIVLAMPRADEYENSHPTAQEIYLILEVSDSTLGYDRNTKGEAYARAGIRQYLVLNVPEKTLEDYREPGADGFQSKQTLRAGQEFNLVAFPEIKLNVSDFLPAEKS